jgi:hypothetical protein
VGNINLVNITCTFFAFLGVYFYYNTISLSCTFLPVPVKGLHVISSSLFFIHYLLECPLYSNARMQLFMNITPHTIISIENLLFGSNNLTNEKQYVLFVLFVLFSHSGVQVSSC